MLAMGLLLGILADPLRVDVIELNHVHNAEGKEVFTQWVWWQWSNWHGEYKVRDWRVYEDAQWPVLTGNGWEQRILKPHGQLVIARVRRETWTRYDVELEDRKTLPVNCRNKLDKR